MLRARLLTAAVLAPLAVAAVLLLPAPAFALLMWLIVLLAAWEWAALAGIESAAGRAAYAGLLSLVLAALWFGHAWRGPALATAAATWAAAAVAVATWPRAMPALRSMPIAAALGVPVLGGAWLALVALSETALGGRVIVWTLVLVWLADSAAYFSGRRFGRRKLAPAVSPGKTWEGLAGGAAAALAWGLGSAFWLPGQPLDWLIPCLAAFVAAVFGDLFESALKRARDVKDSGTLLPGHGGVLDRLDASLAALPVVAVLVAA